MKIEALPAVAQTAHDQAESAETLTRQLHDSIEQTLADRRAAREAEIRGMDIADRDLARKLDASTWTNHRRGLHDEAQEKHGERVDQLRKELLDQREKLKVLDELVGQHPSHMLTTLGVTGSDRSASLFPVVQSAGHAMLGQLAKRAIAESDLELGALIAARLSGMRAKDRPISLDDLAGKLVGERHRKQREALELAQERIDSGLTHVTRWLTGKNPSGSGHSKIHRALSVAKIKQQSNADPNVKGALDAALAKSLSRSELG